MIYKMASTNDPIEDLLQKTGLSCEDLLQKLLAYKSLKGENTNKTDESPADTTSGNEKEDVVSASVSVAAEDSTVAHPTSTNGHAEERVDSLQVEDNEKNRPSPEPASGGNDEKNNLENSTAGESHDKNQESAPVETDEGKEDVTLKNTLIDIHGSSKADEVEIEEKRAENYVEKTLLGSSGKSTPAEETAENCVQNTLLDHSGQSTPDEVENEKEPIENCAEKTVPDCSGKSTPEESDNEEELTENRVEGTLLGSSGITTPEALLDSSGKPTQEVKDELEIVENDAKNTLLDISENSTPEVKNEEEAAEKDVENTLLGISEESTQQVKDEVEIVENHVPKTLIEVCFGKSIPDDIENEDEPAGNYEEKMLLDCSGKSTPIGVEREEERAKNYVEETLPDSSRTSTPDGFDENEEDNDVEDTLPDSSEISSLNQKADSNEKSTVNKVDNEVEPAKNDVLLEKSSSDDKITTDAVEAPIDNDTSSNCSINEVQSSGKLELHELVPEVTEKKCAPLPRKRKSISDELVQKFSRRMVDEYTETKIDSNNPNHENDIEVCEMEDCDIKPTFLKLRSDLFDTSNGGKPVVIDVDAKPFVDDISPDVNANVDTSVSEKNVDKRTVSPQLRKIKVGYLKKKDSVETKKLEAINEDTSDVADSTDLSLESSEQEAGGSKSLEEIREHLKLQLTSLRNRKKVGNLIENTCTISSFDEMKINYKKQLLSKDQVQQNDSDSTTTSIVNSETTKQDDTNDSLFSLTQETTFQIVDVQGGVEFSENDSHEDVERCKEPSESGIKLTKTNDITKIKGWKNKKFVRSESGSTEKDPDTVSEDPSNICEDTVNSEGDSVDVEENNEELAPFVSNTLEEFLTENSTLNISYKVPKSGAEEGIKEQNYEEVIVPQYTQPPVEVDKKIKPKGIKAKTLAEKRRMLEAEIPKKHEKQHEKDDTVLKTSYVIYNGRKLYIPSTYKNKCLAEISNKSKGSSKESTDKPKNSLCRKISLLDMWHQKTRTVTYKPGPLSQKWRLQNSESLPMWDTVLQKLPDIKLEVIPEFKTPISPRLLKLLPQFGTVIDTKRLEFALTAVPPQPDDTKKAFRFSVPYANNQKYILIRTKKKHVGSSVIMDIKPERNSVKSVLDDLITYVETKEIEESIIKDAEPCKDSDNETQPRLHTPSDDLVVNEKIVVKRVKKTRVDHELLRLNCKVVNVAVNDTNDKVVDCRNSFCKLGCICRSLACLPHLPTHCSKIECMFDCKCRNRRGVSVTTDSTILSSDTVNRIEDQAKRNLAKVEKEFTQTVIHTDGKTIIIPSTDRNKTKRTKRMPKRFCDYLEDYTEEDEDTKPIQTEQPAKASSAPECSTCYVKLERLNLKNVVPLCLEHERYHCSCLEIKPWKRRRTSLEEQKILEEPLMPRRARKRMNSFKTDDNTTTVSNKKKKVELQTLPTDEQISQLISAEEARKAKRTENCARIFGVPSEVVKRNKIPCYIAKLKQKIKYDDILSYNEALSMQDINYTEEASSDVDIDTPLPLSAVQRLKLHLLDNCRHKRKQVLEVRQDVENLISQQRPPKKSPISDSNSNNPAEGTTFQQPANVFDGEILIPTNENKDFVRKLGVKTVAPFMRLLPWSDLLQNYYNNRINIWCSIERNDKLLINTKSRKPPKGYIDIAKSGRKNGIMTWILTKELPKQTPSALVHLILSPWKEHFEISGICLKNIPTAEKVDVERESQRKKLKTSNNTDEESNKSKDGSSENENGSEDPGFLEHRDHKNELNVLYMSQVEYRPQVFHLSPTCKNICNEEFPLYIELPNYRPFRWRMLYLNSNFSYLSFINNKYSIKYTDLMHILKKSQTSNKTICLQSKQLSEGFCVKHFGIYAVPRFRDRLFIGPYKSDEDHGLETLRYLRQSLVSTSYFEMVQGASPNVRKAVWIFSKTTKSETSKNPGPSAEPSDFAEIIPIQCAPSTSGQNQKAEEQCKSLLEIVKEHSDVLKQCDNFLSIIDLETRPVVRFPQFTLLNGQELKQQDFNRYIMTNIPHFGYLGAVQNEQTKTIDVSWPFAEKVLRFAHVTAAIDFLTARFTNMMVCIPASFKIQLIILREIDHALHYLINPRVLCGTFICGEFGVHNGKYLKPKVALEIGTTIEEVKRTMEVRAERLVQMTVNKLAQQERQYIGMKKKLIEKKQKNLTQFMELLKKLPEQERLKVYGNFRKDFNARALNDHRVGNNVSRRTGDVVECIEIDDSDSDSENPKAGPSNQGEVTPSPFKKGSVMKSILKPKEKQSEVVLPINKTPKYTEGLKFVKTAQGRLVLLEDSNLMLSTTLEGMKMTIRNNRVECVQHGENSQSGSKDKEKEQKDDEAQDDDQD